MAPAHYDLVTDTCATTSFSGCLPLLARGGRYLGIAADLPGMLARQRDGRKSICGTAPDSLEYLQAVMDLAEAGVLRPLVDTVFGFDELPAAHAWVDSGRKRGSVVVRALRRATQSSLGASARSLCCRPFLAGSRHQALQHLPSRYSGV